MRIHGSAITIVLIATFCGARCLLATEQGPLPPDTTAASKVTSDLFSMNEVERRAAREEILSFYSRLERRLIDFIDTGGISQVQRDESLALLADLRSPHGLEWLLIKVDEYKRPNWTNAQATSLRDYPNARKLVEYKEAATGAILNFISVRSPGALPDRHLRLFAHVILHVEGYAASDRDRIVAYIESKPLDGPHREDVAKLISLLKTVKIREPVESGNVEK
jgi:hypothetical protein